MLLGVMEDQIFVWDSSDLVDMKSCKVFEVKFWLGDGTKPLWEIDVFFVLGDLGKAVS